MPDEFTRRQLLRATSAAAIGVGAVGPASASGLPTTDDSDGDHPTVIGRAPCLDLSDVEMNTRPVDQYGVPEQATGVRPGSQMFIEFPDGGTAGCTANFIWESFPGSESGDASADDQGTSSGGDLYIGAAGHCFLPTDAAASENAATAEERQDGEAFDTSQLGTVSVCLDCTFGGATGLSVVEGPVVELGEVVYARQEVRNGEDGPGHDFGIVRIPADKRDLVDPSMPQWGGPNGVSGDAIDPGLPINQYGAGVANGEVYPTMGSSGTSFGGNPEQDTWFAGIRASPGDSGSPIIGALGTGKEAGGILTHLTTAGIAGTTMDQCRAMVERDIGLEIDVVLP
ncbi:hypothetical protein BRC89_04605 [Halobacteriales archaeon QS_4_70_19]|nr:MAG: hypothetical protein BRC89_04605 [Halobacteriales archaeon QS_4_70_19]